jgi:hypothetical protein
MLQPAQVPHGRRLLPRHITLLLPPMMLFMTSLLKISGTTVPGLTVPFHAPST